MGGYRLAPASSHLAQLILATLPIFAVLVYFLYVAAVRPTKAYYNQDDVDDDATLAAMIAADGALIRMSSMLYVFLAFLLFWSVALFYTWIYVPKRRNLVRSYAADGRTVIGDVRYLPRKGLRYVLALCKRFAPEYAAVTYRHRPDAVGDSARNNNLDPDKAWTVTKRVRTYQPYSREKVAILVLPGLPRSGQPKSDVDIDVASFTENTFGARDRTGGIVAVMAFWVVFTLLGSAFVVYQMGKLQDDPDVDADSARKFWLGFVCVLTPLVAIGGNHVRWVMYRRWMVRAGRYVEEGTRGDVAVRPSYEDDEPGCDGGVCHATLCAGGDGDGDSVLMDEGESDAAYKEMV